MMARMTGAGWFKMFWDTFNIEIDCSVMRLSCLDELLNNDIFWLFYLCHLRDMSRKEDPVFWWNLWLMEVDVLFLSFFARNDNIFLDGIL